MAIEYKGPSGPVPEYNYVPGKKWWKNKMKSDFDRDGFLFVRGLFTPEEMDKLRKGLAKGNLINHKLAFGLTDKEGKSSKIVIWNHPGHDFTGMMARCRRMVDTSEKLLGGEVYHYNSRLNMKQPRDGGSYQWHQDYGYWYQFNLFPRMITVMIGVDRCDVDNGCLRVLRGSHELGRVDLMKSGKQQEPNPERMTEV